MGKDELKGLDVEEQQSPSKSVGIQTAVSAEHRT